AGGRAREVDDAALVVGEAVVDAHHHAASAGEQRDPHAGAEGEGRVGGGELVHVEALAGGRALALVLLPVPGGRARLREADVGPQGRREVVALARARAV